LFKEIVFGALGYVVLYKGALLKMLFLPFVLYILLEVIIENVNGLFLEFSTGIAGLLLQTIIAVTTHRIILLGPKSMEKSGVLNWARRDTSFFMHGVGLGLLVIPIFALSFLPMGPIGFVIAIIISMWIVGRLSLVFPGIAIDHNITFKKSWGLTKNYQFIMFLVVIVFPILLFIPSVLVSKIPYTFLITSLLSTLTIVLTVSALSVTYKLVTNKTYDS